jgi:mono/diheme cytochrome c family protein
VKALPFSLSISILIPVIACAQQGEKIFKQTCATGYCHGAKGEAGGAPRLAGRGFDQDYINTTIARGIPGTAMQGFGNTLSRSDLAAVAGYVGALNGVTSTTVAQPAKSLSPEAARGRDLFSEAVRSFARCSTCHEVNGIGIPVATPIATVPASVAALRTLATPDVRTASLDGETIPALVIGEVRHRMILYDLTSAPPVQRSLDPAAVKLNDGSGWKHASAISSYSDAELSSILTYLRTTVRKQTSRLPQSP